MARLRLRNLIASGSRSARVLERLLERPAALLTGVLISITALNYAAETVVARWAIGRMGEGLGSGVAIVCMTVMVRGLMFPISRKQALSAKRMRELQPEIERLKKQDVDKGCD